jgi:hypothetical protein
VKESRPLGLSPEVISVIVGLLVSGATAWATWTTVSLNSLHEEIAVVRAKMETLVKGFALAEPKGNNDSGG